MNKIIFILFLLVFSAAGTAQTKPAISRTDIQQNRTRNENLSNLGSNKSTSNKNIKNDDAKITDYLIVSQANDTTYIDTTLTVKKEYKYNYLRKDNFNLMPFANIGQSYNTLSYDFENTNLLPSFGAQARHFNYMEADAINYYHVPTPLTELFYKTAFKQGQLLDAFFTVNTSKQFNASIAYKGLRSLGNYQNTLTSTGNFRFTSSYQTKNKRYTVRGHFVAQDLMNQENGGLRNSNVLLFETGDKDLLDRGRLEVNFEDAENILKGKRYYLDHSYQFIKKEDSTSQNTLNVKHVISLDRRAYKYEQLSAHSYFGEAFQATTLKDSVSLENFYNQLQVNYTNNTIGELQFNVSNNHYNYGYDKIVILENQTLTNRLIGDIVAVGGKYKKQIGQFQVKGDLGVNVTGDFDGNYFKGEAAFALNKDILLSAQLNHSSKAPNYNVLLYQSNYINYNWQNSFNNIKTQQVAFHVESEKYLNLSIDATTVNDYVYFKKSEANGLVKPHQSNASISYLRLKANKEFKVGDFRLNNTLMYQSVKDDNQVFNVPEIITRNTLYYSKHVFKKAMYLQTGFTLNYFTEYNMNGYDPLLAEFYVQNDKKYGGFPRLDFFINAKVRQTRIYLKAEHFNAPFTGYDYYSAPNHPYRDFAIRFGLVWNFFL
ncbi:putative porin [Bizionia paragorgiae]|uniref:Putative porin n=1 Tax=Bizionia paragorgiae TaxID=283786 RepID=A0A1H3WQN5_BIZPA|nr:putative porin [Bizionia paragorgiae]SDZ88664.1 Putative porin [Bizionia paragorgiae]